MKIASPTRYEVSANFSASGFSPMSAAIAGSDVGITVESMFSMNSAQATMSGMRTARCKDGTERGSGKTARGRDAPGDGSGKSSVKADASEANVKRSGRN